MPGFTQSSVTPAFWKEYSRKMGVYGNMHTWGSAPMTEFPTRPPTRRHTSPDRGSTPTPAALGQGPTESTGVAPGSPEQEPEESQASPQIPPSRTSTSVPDTRNILDNTSDTRKEMIATFRCLRLLGYLLIGTNTLVVASSFALLGLATFLFLWTQRMTLVIQNDVLPSLQMAEELLKELQQILN